MKKFLLCLLCLCIVFSTVGCAGGGTSSGDAVGTVGKDSKNDNFPLTKEKVTFTIMATPWGNQGP